MFRNPVLFATGISALLLTANVVSAQLNAPYSPFNGRILVPKIDGLPDELQREFDKIQEELDQVFRQGFVPPNRAQGRRPASVNAMRWGGMQLAKVSAEEQEKLGIPENEGLLVTAVEANSIADKAGLKAKDVLVKVNDKAVSSEPTAFAKLVKDQNAAEPVDLVVLRDGKEETIKNAKLPDLVQLPNARPNPAFGGMLIRPNMAFPPLPLNPRLPFAGGLGGLGGVQNLNVEMVINGAKISKRQNGDGFSGEYAKDDLRIKVAGKMNNGVANASEISIQEGKQTNTYKSVSDVPAAHRTMVQQLMPLTLNSLLLPLQQFQDLQNFPGLPVIPGIDNE